METFEQEALLSGEDEDSPLDLERLGAVQLTSGVGEQALGLAIDVLWHVFVSITLYLCLFLNLN